MNVRLLRLLVCLAICVPVTSLPAMPPQSAGAPNPDTAQARKAEARRFMARRGIFGAGGARELKKARQAHAAMAATALSGIDDAALLNQPWQPLGPAQVLSSAYGKVTGRVTSLAADPSDASGNTVYVGTTGGGVWKSTNAAGPAASVVFSPLTDDLPAFSNGNLASLSIGALSVQPGGTGVVLAGTGDPNDALDSYYGSGLLRSADGGLTWTLISSSNDAAVNSYSDYYFIGLAFAGFAWSTQTPNLVVAAVSQSVEGILSGVRDQQTQGGEIDSVMGLYYSTDAGQTWLLANIVDGPGQTIQSSNVPVESGGNAVTAVVWNPVRKRFYAAVRYHGYYESLDGITFTRLASQPGAGLTTTECPTDPRGTGSPACPILRGALAAQPVTGDMFALTVDVNLLDQGLWQDKCSAVSGACSSNTVTFGQRLPSAALEDGNGAIPQGDYSLGLAAVAVTGDTLLFAGTTDIFRCSLGAGCVFRNTTNSEGCAAAQVGPAQHAIDATFAAPLSLMYFGNDSGLWRSSDDVNQTQQTCLPDDANHFQNLNSGLGSLAEVQDFSQDATTSSTLLAGLGVNGTAAATSPGQIVWPQVIVLGGYGSYVAIDPVDSQKWYAQSSAGVGIDLCGNAPSCAPQPFATTDIGFPQIGLEAFAPPEPSPFLLDPLDTGPNGRTNLIVGTCHVWRGPANGASWSSAANLLGDLYPGEGPDCGGNAFIQTLATGVVANPSGNVETIYAGMAGIGFDGPQAYSGHLFEAAVSDAAPIPAGWTDLWTSPVVNDPKGFNPQDYSVSSVTVDSHDVTGETIYATIQGFDTMVASTGTVYASTNGGASWVNIRSNLPGAPANSVAVDPNDANTVYVALDTGVYVTTAVTSCSTQNCWSVYGTGLPNSPVLQLATFNQGNQALLLAGTYGRGIWQVPLITAAATSTTATATPAALTFTAQQIETQSAAQTVTVTNTGTIAMVVNQIAVGGDFAETDTCNSPVAVGGSCAVQVSFAPTAVGTRSSTLTVYANIPGGQVTAALSGTGIPGGAIVLQPASMVFPVPPAPVPLIGQATAAQNIAISNTGGVAVSLQTPTATTDFSIVANTCSASLAPNSGCTVALTFTPSASGQRSGVFSIVDSVGTQTVSLSGTGQSPATDGMNPVALTFAPQVVGTASPGQAVTLTNTGDASLDAIAVSITGDFQAIDSCGRSLIGHASCSIGVTFVPQSVGAEAGILSETDIYGRTQTVALNGTGVAPAGVTALPKAINFGAWGVLLPGSPAQTVVAVTSSPQPVTLTNSGGLPLNNLSFAVTGDFAISSNSCAEALSVEASCSPQLVFSPTQSGPRSGTLTVASSSLAAPFVIALSGNGFGFVMSAVGSPAAGPIAAGQTATYTLEIDPGTGSSGSLTSLTCTAAPTNSTCTVEAASLELSSGVPNQFKVTIATVAATVSPSLSSSGRQRLSVAILLPAGVLFFAIPWTRRRAPPLAMLFAILVGAGLLISGCGVVSTGGTATTPIGGGTPPVSTPSAIYNPVITATGPGISQSVTLTLTVD